jgi:hypothetical protein
MEVYTLDALMRREEVIDDFESLIWTERFLPWGDFELQMRPTLAARSLLTEGTKIAMNKSLYVGEVETIVDEVNEDDVKVLTIKGRTIEKIMEDRTAAITKGATTNWVVNGVPAAVARWIFKKVCVEGVLSEFDVIPFIHEGLILPASTIPEPIDPIIWSQPPQTVYKALYDLCSAWNLGFRILRKYDTTELYFDVYAGSDRTTRQSLLSPVIFAPELDNLHNTSELRTSEDFKNVANVYTPSGFLEVFGTAVDPEIDGFDRRVLTVVADDISGTGWESAALQRGREELAKHRAFQAFDGEIAQNSQYVYGQDYYLGDLVEQRNTDGVSNDMRVTEQIFVHDKEGERAYPTLTLNQFINTGSWLSWETSKKWIDYDADFATVWASLP